MYSREYTIMIVLFNKVIVDEWFSTDDLYPGMVEPDFIRDQLSLIGNAHLDPTAMVAFYAVVLQHHLATFPHQMDACLAIEYDLGIAHPDPMLLLLWNCGL